MSQAAVKQQDGINVGDSAPAFSCPSETGQVISSGSLKGKKIVLYFYPKDATPGCTTEAQDFRDRIEAFKSAGAVVMGVSRDSVASHEKFAAKQCLPFNLLSDENGSICEDYGVWVEKNMYGKKYMGIERSTFLIDGSGTIRNIWRKVKVNGHADEVLEAAKAI